MCRFCVDINFSYIWAQILDSLLQYECVSLCKKLAVCLPKELYNFAFSSGINGISTSSPLFSIVKDLNFGHSNRCVILNIVLFSFSIMKCYKTYFHMLIYHLPILFDEISTQMFCTSLNQLICFLIVECVYFVSSNNLHLIYLLQFFSPTLWLILFSS